MFSFLHYIRKKYRKLIGLKTQGVRVMLIRYDKVLLVKHRYNDLWVFPGGKLRKRENVYETGRNEVKEETKYIINTFDRTLGVYQNSSGGKNDEVTVLVTTDFYFKKQSNILDKIKRLIEIKEAGWYLLDELPDTVSRATKERVLEYKSEETTPYEGKW